ncbi:protein eva-1 homolog C isoform X3 [Bemisia tabaci]|uniref:protein eva-1 homolog C isoform X3 n=1 Tax=Bemisia tabaci TaxID=7038 RepID=UPI0008F99525|nr:PREDICTED: protein eva-1 homolog C isoform X3 [Bemisia tabaci]
MRLSATRLAAVLCLPALRHSHIILRLHLLYALIFYSAADNLALLSGTLRTYQKAGCNNQPVILTCPPGTCIFVQVAQYGKNPAVCGDYSQFNAFDHSVQTNVDSPTSEPCLWSSALQYALLQTVVEACQKKRQCKINPSPKASGKDSCPGSKKIVEIAYKCRPYEFRSKVACENDVVQLKCNPNSRVAVYSASYGRTEYESVQCPQPQGVPEETCLVNYATETVMQICHGKRRCTLAADAATFGNPCKPESRMYLKVVYTCVPRKVLKEQYEEQAEADELLDSDDDEGAEEISDEILTDPSPNLASGGRHNLSYPPLASASSTATPHLISTRQQSSIDPPENQEKLYLYLSVSVGGGLLVLLLVVIAKLLWQKHRLKKTAKFHESANQQSTSLPNGFTDDISEIDADIDLTMTAPPITIISPHSPSEVVRYGEAHLPKSLSRSGNNQYYYG